MNVNYVINLLTGKQIALLLDINGINLSQNYIVNPCLDNKYNDFLKYSLSCIYDEYQKDIETLEQYNLIYYMPLKNDYCMIVPTRLGKKVINRVCHKRSLYALLFLGNNFKSRKSTQSMKLLQKLIMT